MTTPRVTVARGSGRYGGVPVRGDVLNAINQSFREGLGVTRTREILREAGFAFRNQVITERFRELRLADSVSGNLRFINQNARPAGGTLVQRNIHARTRFTYTGRLRFLDTISGQRADKPFQFGSDTALTRNQIETRAADIANQVQAGADIKEGSPPLDFLGVDLEHAFEDIL